MTLKTNRETIIDVVVYLVDDDRGMVAATSQWLSLSGLEVRAFADPAALVKSLKTTHPCVVVSDIRMPKIDGMELMRLVHVKDTKIPVILITGHGDIPLAVEAMKQGAFEFLPKPFSPESLLETVKKAQATWEISKSAETGHRPEQQTLDQPTEEVFSVSENRDLSKQVEDYEKELIEAALAEHAGSIPKVLETLKIPRRTLNAKMKRYGILRSMFR